MKRFLRWMMTVCLLVGTIYWIRSYWQADIFITYSFGRYQIISNYGVIRIDHWPNDTRAGKTIFIRQNAYDSMTAPSNFITFEFIGLMHGRFLSGGTQIEQFIIPIWMFILPLGLLSAIVWFHPFKAWLRGTHRKGFEVEMKKNESPSPAARESMTPPVSTQEME